MSFSEDFKEQWKSFTNYIVSDIIKNIMNNGAIDLQEIESIYRNEILRWSVDGQYNACWLSDIRKVNGSVAENFQRELENFQFQKAEVGNRNSSGTLGIISAGVGAVVGIGTAALLFHGNILPTIAAGIGAGIVGGVVGSKTADGQKEKISKLEMEEYKKQLSALGEKLTAIVIPVDGKEPFGMYGNNG